jgi:hypothetical protein
MKHPVTRFKSLSIGLKELEPFIRNGQHLLTGKPFKGLAGMRSREALANWLICATANFERGTDRLTFTSDPTGGDGVIFDSERKTTWITEHVMVPPAHLAASSDKDKAIETRILDAIGLKQRKGGVAYVSGKQLVVFLEGGGGAWFPNKVAKRLPERLYFDGVWVVGLQVAAVEYVYGVTQLDMTGGHAPTWSVRIEKDFKAWTVATVQ